MPIAFSCQSCGRSLKVKDDLAGKQIYCPDCKSILYVPTSSANEPMDAEPAAAAATSDGDPFGIRAEEPAPPPAPRKPSLRDEDDWDDDDDRPRRKPKPKPPASSDGSGASGIIGGIIMMLIAVVWFVAGLAFDRIFFYPPILFIIGLVAFFRGLFTAAKGD